MSTPDIRLVHCAVRRAAESLSKCDSEDLVTIARDILRLLATDELTAVERRYLAQAADRLLSDEAFGRATWRLAAARGALRLLDRLALVQQASAKGQAS